MKYFTGMWELVVIQVLDDKGNWIERNNWSKGGSGLLIYDGKGHMAVNIVSADYSNYKIKSSDSTSIENYKLDIRHFTQQQTYFSKCRIIEPDIMEHSKLSSVNSEDWNKTVQRKFEFKGDTLFLYQVENANKARLVWKKCN